MVAAFSMHPTQQFIVAFMLRAISAPSASTRAQSGSSHLAVPSAVAHKDAGAAPNSRESMCLMIESEARANELPLEFFARVIWQESRFQADAVGPRTRSGDSAQGIAQFMPRTAAERGLLDPFDPVQALSKSAQFLRELRGQFGNLGLAAAAYNAGPQRVRDWIRGARTLPAETLSLRPGHHRGVPRGVGEGDEGRTQWGQHAELPAADGSVTPRPEPICGKTAGADRSG